MSWICFALFFLSTPISSPLPSPSSCDIVSFNPSAVDGSFAQSLAMISVLKTLLLLEQKEGSHVVVMVTCRSRSSLHPTLVDSRGHHLFPHTVDISAPDQVWILLFFQDNKDPPINIRHQVNAKVLSRCLIYVDFRVFYNKLLSVGL